MLGKLIKYELKASARTFLPLYLGLLLISVINRFIFSSESAFEVIRMENASFLIFIYFALVFAILIITTWIILQRFYKNLLGNEGYLMFTLPVSTHKIIFSKILASSIWIFLSFFVVSLSSFILVLTSRIIGEIPDFMYETFVVFSTDIAPFIIEIILLLIISMWSFITLNYAALSLGHLMGRNKILSSIGAYILLSIATDWATKLASLVFDNPFVFNWLYSLPIHMQNHLTLISNILGLLLLTIIYFTISNWVLKNKLNLE